MKAIVITAHGGPEVLKLQERAVPTLAAGELLVQVKAAGINRPDVFQRKGNYPAPAGQVADIPGLEVAGIIEAIGEGVEGWQLGEAVCCLVAAGGYAEYVAVSAQTCLPIPAGFSFAEAAILPETIYTVWDNVFRRGMLAAGEGILIQGGSGGIGSTAIQLAKAFGARVFTTVSSVEKQAYCRALGADIAINYKEADFQSQLAAETVNVVLDSIGGAYFEQHIDLLAADGRLVHINAMAGAKVSLNIFKLMQKRIVITGSTLRARELAFKSQLTAEIKQHVWPILGEKFIPQLYKSFDLENAAEAHALMDSGDFLGKLVLTL